MAGEIQASVVRLERQWFPVCASRELASAPIARVLQGTPLAIFRDRSGAPAALLDRCAHRNVPLSLGRRAGGQLECSYHGWRFDASGACRAIPGLCGAPEAAGRAVPSYPAVEQDGLVWVYATPGPRPEALPFRFPLLDDPRYTTVRQSYALRATLHAAVENALDVPHTGFLHGGLFRSAEKRHALEVALRRGPASVEAEYIGEPRPSGLLGRLLAPGGGAVVHFDRFFLPSIAQVEYRLGERSHLVVTTAFTPVSDFETHLFAAVTFRLPVAGWLLRPILRPIGMRVLRQDAAILAAQTDNVGRFGGEHFAHTEIDVLGPHIWHLLRQAERGQAGEAFEPARRRLLT
jgi:phenylpropionate dioxygenase-like ring-hydroxylating dioxygenase large terminal subunit